MSKKTVILISFLLFILVIISLYDGFAGLGFRRFTPLFVFLMFINIIVAIRSSKKVNKVKNDYIGINFRLGIFRTLPSENIAEFITLKKNHLLQQQSQVSF